MITRKPAQLSRSSPHSSDLQQRSVVVAGKVKTEVGSGPNALGRSSLEPAGTGRHAPEASNLRPAVAKTDWVFARQPRGGNPKELNRKVGSKAGEHHGERSSPKAVKGGETLKTKPERSGQWQGSRV